MRPSPVTPATISSTNSSTNSSTAPSSDKCCPGLVRDLVLRCGHGDDVALGRLVDVFLPTVLGIVGDGIPSELNDTRAVETFHRVWLHAPTYDPTVQDAVSWVLDQARAGRGRPAPAQAPAA